MITAADFLPYILPYADGLPEFVGQDAIVGTIQDFYRQTKEKEVELPAIDLVAGQGVYTLTVANAHVFDITSAVSQSRLLTPSDPANLVGEIGGDWRQRSGTPTFFYMPGLDQIRLVATPDADFQGGLFVVCATYPAHTAASFDDVLLEEHRDLIVNGALSRLLTQQDQKWTDMQQGVARGLAYQAGIERHISRVARGRVRSRKRVVGHYF